jgi:soluble lytic murein transglycosylase-like protein
VTQAAELPRLGWRVTRHLRAAGDAGWSDRDLGASLYPVPPWSPRDGFRLDRALIYAFMRQESSFDPQARSPDGARGLMQLMPATASALDRKREFRGDARDELFDPALNLSLGQRYLAELLASRRVRGDLLRLAVAYNAGPGNLGNWERLMDYGGDPLLFIESLPTLETRLFAERVLANLWIYRVRLGQPTPSLDALAADRWPAYEPLDAVAGEVAGRP